VQEVESDVSSKEDKEWFWEGWFNNDESTESVESETSDTDSGTETRVTDATDQTKPEPGNLTGVDINNVAEKDIQTTYSVLNNMLANRTSTMESDYDISDEKYPVVAEVYDMSFNTGVRGVHVLAYNSEKAGVSNEDGLVEFEAHLINESFVRIAFRSSSSFKSWHNYESKGVIDLPVSLQNEKLIAQNRIYLYSDRNFQVKYLEAPNDLPINNLDVVIDIAKVPQGDTEIVFNERYTKTTRGDGTLDIPFVPNGKYVFSPISPGTQLNTSMDIAFFPNDPLEIRMSPISAITGIVYSPDGKPVSGVNVHAAPDDNENVDGSTRVSVTGEDGTFSIGNLTRDSFKVYCDVPNGAPFTSPESSQVAKAAPGNNAPYLIFYLQKGDYVEGYVYDIDDNPIPNVMVTTSLREYSAPVERETNTVSVNQFVHTNEEGYFTVTGIARGSSLNQLYFIHPDYETELLSNTNLFEGEQIVVLNKINQVTLKVVWDDGTPISYFAYRMLQEGWNGFDVLTGKESLEIYSEDGTTDLSDLPNGKYSIEITVLDPDGQLTNIRDSVDFELEAGGQDIEILVDMFGGHRVEGQVIFADDGNGVPDTTVYLVPPASGAVNYNRFTNSSFDRLETVTDGEGYFSFDGISPGNYTLEAINEELIQNIPLDFVVEKHTAPNNLTMTLYRGGVIQGYVRGADGSPVNNASISHTTHSTNLDRWVRNSTNTNEEGFYELRGMRRGMHYLSARANGETISKDLDLELSEVLNFDFEFAEQVTVQGTITLKGNPEYNFNSVRLLSPDGFTSPWSNATNNRFSFDVLPGRYKVAVSEFQGESELFTVKSSPDVQEFDFEIESASADVVVIFPEGSEFVEGKLVIAPKDMSFRYR